MVREISFATILFMAAGCVGQMGGVPFSEEDDAGVVTVVDASEDTAAADSSASGEGDSDAGEAVVVDETDGDVQVVEAPWVEIMAPTNGVEAPNPVTFRFATGSGVTTVQFLCDDWPLQESPISVDRGEHTYDFSGVNRARTVVMNGYDGAGNLVASDEVTFVPFREACSLRDMPGFNHYTVAAINDTSRLPRDGSYPYCWGESWCGENWGQIHDGIYGSELIFPGGGDCFCSGYTLEIFLRAFQIYLAEEGLPESTLFHSGGNVLTVDDVDIGGFYQWWQGFGVASFSSSAEAFEQVGIGESLWEEQWSDVLPGDFVNLSRSNGTGHAVIFIDWLWDGGTRVGLRYYGCSNSGDSCPDPSDPENRSGVSGPSFSNEYFEGHGGRVLPNYLFIGRVFMPDGAS